MEGVGLQIPSLETSHPTARDHCQSMWPLIGLFLDHIDYWLSSSNCIFLELYFKLFLTHCYTYFLFLFVQYGCSRFSHRRTATFHFSNLNLVQTQKPMSGREITQHPKNHACLYNSKLNVALHPQNKRITHIQVLLILHPGQLGRKWLPVWNSIRLLKVVSAVFFMCYVAY